MFIHVSKQGADTNAGTEEAPFLTIGRAAEQALPGETVVVHEGVYREWVKPPRGGFNDSRRITYKAAEGEHVVIKGSEVVDGWESDGDLWRVAIPNSLFGDDNPFAKVVEGDWLVRPDKGDPQMHLGQVYIDGVALPEYPTVDALRNHPSQTLVVDDWTGVEEGTRPFIGGWTAEVGEDKTVVHAHFGDVDPSAGTVEVNVRRSVFFPERHHVDYITVRGFELAHAASPWAPPTADQPGLIGPNWAKGWIIEDNIIHDAKCSAISLGKEINTGHNFATTRRDKPGYQYQLESVFKARHLGWSKERIGSHIVRRNHIYDCGQNGIVGHLGCVFSVVEANHIHDIALMRQFYGHEIAGIKLHAAIDVRIEGNNVHDCSLGLWLDWQTQGTRVTRNVFHDNSRDTFIEVSHGPYLVDHNVFASRVSLENFSQGGAFVGNLFLGAIRQEPVVDRATPYHEPHSTEVAGYAIIVGGDDRFIGNIFGDGSDRPTYDVELPGLATVGYGTVVYDGFPANPEAYFAQTESRSGDHRRFATLPQAVTIRDNCYLGGARPYASETGAVLLERDAVVVDTRADGVVELRVNTSHLPHLRGDVDTNDLGMVRFTGASFEQPDGTPISFSRDRDGDPSHKLGPRVVGPVPSLGQGPWVHEIWTPKEAL